MSERLDRALVSRGLVRSRSQGREFILLGKVSVAGQICAKPSALIEESVAIHLDVGISAHRVGRGYDKLAGFLREHPVDFNGRYVVDGGACTGGFTQIALERGARAVCAVDIGHAQLDPALSADPRVELLESTDIRQLKQLASPCEILLLDLSGPSLRDVLSQLEFPIAAAALLIALCKPQYELGGAGLTAGGRVRDPARAEKALAAVLAAIRAAGWEPQAWQAVELGPEQRNRETFILAHRAE